MRRNNFSVGDVEKLAPEFDSGDRYSFIHKMDFLNYFIVIVLKFIESPLLYRLPTKQ